VIVTGYEDLTGAVAALRNGASDYLIKPVDADTLRTRLRQLAAKRRAELALKIANSRMLQAERLAAIGQMMTGLVHESRTALQRGQACLEMLSFNLQGQQDSLELVARVQKAQKKVHELFEEVRNYAAPIRLQRTAHDLRHILEETWENLVWTRQGRDVFFRMPTSGSTPRCSVDASRLEQVFRNILENSLAACADPVRIEITWKPTTLDARPAWQLSFADNGPGMTSEQRQKIFEPFFTTKPTGTGLGMAISKRIIEEHGGTIAVNDGFADGAEIVITLLAT
jgi:signal transduction histidine kinase